MHPRNLRQLINFSVTQWFQFPKRDSISPAETVMNWNDLFLEAVARYKFELVCSEQEFRNAMCEALCTMYLAKKRNADWRGPLSRPPRPDGWTSSHEMEWRDILQSRYFTSEIFEGLWANFEKAIWENAIPDWRTSFEIICLHYIQVEPELVTDMNEGELENIPIVTETDDSY